MKKWDRGYIQSAGDRFQFDTLQRRFQTFVDLWDRGLRAREEGRPGPFGTSRRRKRRRRRRRRTSKIVHVTSFQDPMREMDKLHTLYDSLMDARREAGDDVVPFHRFAALVKDQVTKLKAVGYAGSRVPRGGGRREGELYGEGTEGRGETGWSETGRSRSRPGLEPDARRVS